MKPEKHGHEAMMAALAESITKYPQKKKSSHFISIFLWSIVGYMVVVVFIFLWVCGFKAGVEKTIALWPEPIKIKHSSITHRTPFSATGTASWYNYKLKDKMWSLNHATAASRVLPKYTTWKITNLDNNKSVMVYINDFGPEEWTNRDIDLSSYAFSQIANLSQGIIKIKIEKEEKKPGDN